MRGVSARSLDEILSAVDAAQGSSETLGTQLFGVVSLLDANPALRRVLTDPSTEADAKAGLAARVLGSQVDEQAVGVVRTAVAGRWAAGRDLADALETAGAAALVARADTAGNLERLETELFEVGRTVASDPELRGVVADRSYPAQAKAELLGRLLEGKVSPETLALAQQAVVARTGSFEKVLTAFGEVAARRRGRAVALVRVAYELSDDERSRLAGALARKYGRDVHLNVVVDPAVVGGISVSLDGEVVDGTMSSRLEAARRRLAG
ncbi:MAG: F0F1 ATP synthase subunit delta [Aeromicrobium erythreum]